MKQRFSTIDVMAIVQDLQPLVGYRLQNVYDLNAKTFLLKFYKPDSKEYLVVQSGYRIHLTKFTREKSSMPSFFCSKMRKELNKKRVTSISQIGRDRIIKMEFNNGLYFLVFEFYSNGNIIVLNKETEILVLFRFVKNNENIKMETGEKYNFLDKKDNTELSLQNVINFVKENIDKAKKESMKKIIANVSGMGTSICEHCLIINEIEPSLKFKEIMDSDDNIQNEFIKNKLQKALMDISRMIEEFMISPSKGYVIQKEITVNDNKTLVNEEFQPKLFEQYKGSSFIEYETFNEAIDKYYSTIEETKQNTKEQSTKNQKHNKLNNIKEEQMLRVRELESQCAQNEKKAKLIEENLEIVDQITTIINSMISLGTDWIELENHINEEKEKGNTLARAIRKLKLKTNQITVYLKGSDEKDKSYLRNSRDSSESSCEESDFDANMNQGQEVDIDISKTAYANAREYYEMRKSNMTKMEKTHIATKNAIKSAEKKIEKELLKSQSQKNSKKQIFKLRQPFWFEKFHWFVSSDNHLVIGGRDPQQNEILVKRHLREGDIYVHADTQGAASVIIKGNRDSKDATIPPNTLLQAGTLSICQSKAWESKTIVGSYWVYHNQVSKVAVTGDLLDTGSFIIRGKKNFIPPSQLIYGIGIMFVVDEESIERRRLKKESLRDIAVDNEEPRQKYEKYNLDEYEEETNTIIETLIKNVEPNKQKKMDTKNKSQNKDNKSKIHQKPIKFEKKNKDNLPTQTNRNKKKKNKKYDESLMDEDEIKLSMELLGIRSHKNETINNEIDIKNDKETTETGEKTKEVETKENKSKNNGTKFTGESKLTKNSQDAETQHSSEDEKVNEPPYEQKYDLKKLDSLVADINENEETPLYAVPMGGPYQAFTKFKYKYKLIPGSLKKGKAYNAVLNGFTLNNINTIEKELILNITENEMYNALISKSKIMGLNKK